MNKKEILIKAGKEYFYSGNDEFNTSRFAVCVNSLLQFVRKQTQILGAQEPEHIPDFSPRVLDKERYNSAVVLYFKALVSFSDLYVLQKIGDTPSSHNDRFKITKEKFPEVYNLLDKDFPFYQSSYNERLKFLTKLFNSLEYSKGFSGRILKSFAIHSNYEQRISGGN